MSFPVNFTLANPPVGYCPTTITQLYDGLRNDLSGEVSTSFVPYILGASTPAVEDQDKAWIRLDAAGRPLGTFLYYAGSWRRQYTGNIGQLTFFSGDPSLYFDGTGKGLTTSDWDGWALCNGQNGTPNLSDRFLIGAHMDNSSGQAGFVSGVWRSTAYLGVPLDKGGRVDYTFVQNNIPTPASDMLVVDLFEAGATRDNSGKLYGIHSTATGAPGSPGTKILIDEVAAAPPITPAEIIPPFYAFAIVKFLGYS